MISNNIQIVIPTIVGIPGNEHYNYPKFKITTVKGKGLGVIATEDLTTQDLNKFLVHGGIVFNDKQYKKYIKLSNDLKFENNLCNSNISHITQANNHYLNANPILYKDKIKNGWIGSYVNEVNIRSRKEYNADLIVLTSEQVIYYKSQIDNLPDCIDKNHIVGICIRYAVKKNEEITVNYGDEETFIRVNYKQKQPQITYNEDGSVLELHNVHVLSPRTKIN
jgi:hypothetical protein